MSDPELEALNNIDRSLGALDEDTRIRVLRWAWSKFGSVTERLDAQESKPLSVSESQPTVSATDSEIPGIARINDAGELLLTVRDLKAKNTNDAAIRLVHIMIRANEILTGEDEVSSRNVVSPMLKKWRAYSGNTRRAIADHKGILRTGDSLSLDAHSKREADEYINQVLDESIQGSWNPSGAKKAKGRKKIKRDNHD